ELGGWGEYKAVLCIDGIPKEVATFRLDRQEDLDLLAEEERQRKEAEEAFKRQFSTLEARNLLGEPDRVGERELQEEVTETGQDPGKRTKPVMETWEPEEWYRTGFTNEEGRIIVFPKRARQSWGHNVEDDLRYRIKRYIYE